MELRSQNQQTIEALDKKLNKAQADLRFTWRLAFTVWRLQRCDRGDGGDLHRRRGCSK